MRQGLLSFAWNTTLVKIKSYLSCAALAAALFSSSTALADRYVSTADDLRTQFYLHMPFNQGPEFVVNQLKRDGYDVMDQGPWKITLRRDVSDGTVVLNISVNKQNKVRHVLKPLCACSRKLQASDSLLHHWAHTQATHILSQHLLFWATNLSSLETRSDWPDKGSLVLLLHNIHFPQHSLLLGCVL